MTPDRGTPHREPQDMKPPIDRCVGKKPSFAIVEAAILEHDCFVQIYVRSSASETPCFFTIGPILLRVEFDLHD